MSGIKVLIVDDSVAIRKSLVSLLSPLAVRIEEATNGAEGLERAVDGNYDIIISDIDMPGLDGISLCQRLKSETATRGIPVVIVSSFDSDHDINRGFEAGASAYVSKDEAKEVLYETVEQILSKSDFKRKQVIMIVDDSNAIRLLVETGLSQAGFQIITAENGKAALEILENDKPDLILSDIDMPVMNGFEFCEAVHANPVLSSIPFVVMSANSDRGYMQRMLQHGAAAYLCKPFNIDQLVITVEKILSDQFLLLLKEKERLDTEKDLMIASISSLVTALEARDAYTKGHSEAVGDIISGMLGMTGASRADIETVFIGGRLHDIGKIGVRDDVLLKPGRLTEEEFLIIKQHPVIGADIIKTIPSLSEILPIVQFHHERIDGNGYPKGLKGDEIPFWAKITAVADTYHALTSERPYREPVGHDKALQIIEDVRGTQLCSDCVDLFFKWISLPRDSVGSMAGSG